MSDEYISKEQFISHYRKLLCEDCNHRKQYRNGKLINRFVYEIGGPPCRACEIDDMLDRVEDFEPADVAPVKHGKWKEHPWAEEVNGFLISNYVCSCCGEWARYNTRYCPNCGALMEVR